jgi:hypothetical protein
MYGKEKSSSHSTITKISYEETPTDVYYIVGNSTEREEGMGATGFEPVASSV